MRAHLLQLDLAWEDRQANFRLVDNALDRAKPEEGDLVVLPELFDSAFSLNAAKNADRNDETLRFLLELSDDLGVTIQGSRTLLPCDCDKAFNNATVVAPEQRLLCEYSKVHPFTYGKEPDHFRGGETVTTYTWSSGDQSLTVCPAVCYDLRFPELFRAGLAKGAELFAIGANWPDTRQSHWRALAIARAIENQAFVLAVNRTGNDPHLSYTGGTIAIGPKGDILGELDNAPGVLTVEIDPDSVRAWRDQFPAWRDGKIHTL